jgi:hypothetical protein
MAVKHRFALRQSLRRSCTTNITQENLTVFLLACRAAYNEFVLYHNFRHVADVLQALFYFLLQIGTIPPYPTKDDMPYASSPPIVASLLKPFDALTLLISAIGHDVGHPGVNNAFLVALNAPLAQLYNDRSVLESFHCAAYSQILRRFWPEAFADIVMRKLMINSILATDMGLHFKYMTDLGRFEEKLVDNKNTIDGWNPKTCEEYKDLMCGLLIKCADISNVVSASAGVDTAFLPRYVPLLEEWAFLWVFLVCQAGRDDRRLTCPIYRHESLTQPPDGRRYSQTNFLTREPWSWSYKCPLVFSGARLSEIAY